MLKLTYLTKYLSGIGECIMIQQSYNLFQANFHLEWFTWKQQSVPCLYHDVFSWGCWLTQAQFSSFFFFFFEVALSDFLEWMNTWRDWKLFGQWSLDSSHSPTSVIIEGSIIADALTYTNEIGQLQKHRTFHFIFFQTCHSIGLSV